MTDRKNQSDVAILPSATSVSILRLFLIGQGYPRIHEEDRPNLNLRLTLSSPIARTRVQGQRSRREKDFCGRHCGAIARKTEIGEKSLAAQVPDVLEFV